MSPSIAIVIPVYNRERYLGEAIESVLVQTRRDFELLVWDDGSDDRSLEVARHYAAGDRRIRVVAAPHQGVAPTLRAAFAATTAPYIGSVDSDDRIAPDALAQTAALLDANPEVGMVYTNYHAIDEQGRDRGLGSRCRVPYSKDRLLIDFMTFHFRLLRRSVYERVGGIDASMERAEDYDLCLRLSEVTQVHHLPLPLYYHRRHAGNMTNQQLEQISWAQKASTQALKRRGLDRHYALDVQLVSKFILRQKG